MELFINGEKKPVPSSLNLRELLAYLQLPADRVAVELNGRIVRRDAWEGTPLKDQDRLEIVHFVGGG
jgi:sulfur carrier protein